MTWKLNRIITPIRNPAKSSESKWSRNFQIVLTMICRLVHQLWRLQNKCINIFHHNRCKQNASSAFTSPLSSWRSSPSTSAREPASASTPTRPFRKDFSGTKRPSSSSTTSIPPWLARRSSQTSGTPPVEERSGLGQVIVSVTRWRNYFSVFGQLLWWKYAQWPHKFPK